jgi:hypothetical protein
MTDFTPRLIDPRERTPLSTEKGAGVLSENWSGGFEEMLVPAGVRIEDVSAQPGVVPGCLKMRIKRRLFIRSEIIVVQEQMFVLEIQDSASR